MNQFHQPVLVAEILEFIRRAPRKTFVDCTLGDGGHSLAVLEACPELVLIGMDVDPEALLVSEGRLLPRYQGRVVLARRDYRALRETLARLGIPRVDGFLFDLGVSSRQLDRPERGFSYKGDAPLDMRMNPESPTTARDILMQSSEAELSRIIWEYGEERFSHRIAREIVKRREEQPLAKASDLVEAIRAAIPPRARKGFVQTVRRTFQALRIAVNDELSRLGQSLEDAFCLLKDGGVLLALSYHSLEDRIVKDVFKRLETRGLGRRLSRKPIRPGRAEVTRNSRAKSAKLRVIERSDYR